MAQRLLPEFLEAGESRRLLIPDSSMLNNYKSLSYRKSKCKYQLIAPVPGDRRLLFEFALDG
jgi:hypothetical protein